VRPLGVRPALFLASLLPLLLAACGSPETPSGTTLSTPLTSAPSATRPTPTPDSPRDDFDPVLYTYCLAEEHIVGIETRLLDKPPPQASRDLREAQVLVYEQAKALAEDARPAEARAVQAWGDAFERSIARMRLGDDPFDALMPATQALGKVGALIDCEVDA